MVAYGISERNKEKKGFMPQIFLSFEPYLFIARSSVFLSGAFSVSYCFLPNFTSPLEFVFLYFYLTLSHD
jgi:hypothetical protein